MHRKPTHNYNKALQAHLYMMSKAQQSFEETPDRIAVRVAASAVRDAETYFISTPIAEILWEASRSLPNSAIFSMDLMERIPCGFIWFDEPFILHYDTGDEQYWVGFVTQLLELRDDYGEHQVRYAMIPLVALDSESAPIITPSTFVSPGASISNLKDNFDFTNGKEGSLRLWTGFLEDVYKFCYSLLRFVSQDIYEFHQQPVSRSLRRRLERSGEMPKSPIVSVVQLRRRILEHHMQDEKTGDREYTHQWIVRGHWRNQWYPSLGIHQPKWIAPYVKGPEDKPFKPSRATVHAVVR